MLSAPPRVSTHGNTHAPKWSWKIENKIVTRVSDSRNGGGERTEGALIPLAL